MRAEEWFPAFERNNIPIVLASSNYYAPYAGVVIRSLIDHASDENNYDIIIIERDISNPNKRILLQMAARRKNISLRFYNPSGFLARVDVSSLGTEKFPLELYYRVLAPYMLGCYERLLTVDADMLVKRDIARLFWTDLEGACIGAVPDIFWQGFYEVNYVFAVNNMSAREYCEQVLGIRDPMNYVSTGLVLYDCDKYRSELDWQTVISVAKSKPFMWLDQCELNVLLEGKIKFLDPLWNVEIPTNARSQYAVDSAPIRSRQAYANALERPGLLHWAGIPKPWVCPDVQYGEEWWETAMRTPFTGHIIARMFDALQTRREYYRNKYGKEVAVWNPVPDVTREM